MRFKQSIVENYQNISGQFKLEVFQVIFLGKRRKDLYRQEKSLSSRNVLERNATTCKQENISKFEMIA